MKKLKIFIILAVMFLTAKTYGQNDCSNAAVLTGFNTAQDYYTNNNEYWLTFTADSSFFYLAFLQTSQSPVSNISSITLYDGINCSNLNEIYLIEPLKGDSTFSLQLQIGYTYYLRIIRDGSNNGYFTLYHSNNEFATSPIPPCGPLVCELNPNTGFTTITTNLLNAITGVVPNDVLFKDPMRKYTEVCNWIAYKGTPQIFYDNGLPWNPYLYMWATNDKYEAVYNVLTGPTVTGTPTGLLAGHTYNVSFKYREQGNGAIDGLKFISGSEVSPYTVVENEQVLDYTINHQTGWNTDNYTFYCNISSNVFIIHPYTSQYGGIDIDDVVITEVLGDVERFDITEYWESECNEYVDLSFTLPSTTGITYTWYLPNNAVISNNIAPNHVIVQWNNAGIATVTVKGTNANGCIIYEGSLEINPNKVACDTETPYNINNMRANQIIQMFSSSTITTNNIIYINGTNIIDEDITFINCPNIKMGLNAKIIVMPKQLYTPVNFVIDNSSISACYCKWDGIFIEDPNAISTLTITNSTVSDAKNAVVTMYNNYTYLFNTYFLNNNIGTWVKNYNPLGVDQFGNPLNPPPSNTSIVKCTYENTDFNNFTTGIIVDTIFNLTIGEQNNSNYTNYFINLYRGIQSTHSDVFIFNNSFDGFTPNIVNYYNAEATSAAIFCKKNHPVFPDPLQNHAILNFVTIGGYSNNDANTFNSQNVGVYAFNTRMFVYNNSFNDQNYTAIHIRDVYYADINDNMINMNSNLWSTNNLYNSSIIAEQSALSFPVNLNINNNNIYNTRTGINIRSLNGDNSQSKFCNILNNTINFYSLGSERSIGINASYVDYCLIDNNMMINYMTSIPSGDMLRGISIASVTNSLIKRNQMIRLERGLFGADNLLGTELFCNNFDYNYCGIWFEPYYTQISDQEYTIGTQGATENYWYDNLLYNSPEMRRIDGGIVLQNLNNPVKWYHSGTFNQTNNIFSPYIPSNHPLYQRITPIPYSIPIYRCNVIPSLINNEEGDKRSVISDIVIDSMQFQVNQSENEYYAKDFAYRKLDNDSSLLTLNTPDDSVYQNFYNNLKTQGIGKFAEISKLINKGKYAEALILNNSVTAFNTIEANKKIVHSIYLQTIVKNLPLSSTDSATLYNIATLLPFSGGEAVYSARVILGLDPADLNLDYVKGNETKTNSNPIVSKVNIYPNPATDYITMDFYILSAKESVFELYDMNARLILTYTINPNTSSYNIGLNALKAGIYYYKLYNAGEILAKNKLVIINK